ncbi:MAG: hypothetical protein LAN37_07805 [Acidobacteriia bacterium]|nr:hypothetical protein [Terriglobia bacterium]
MRGLKELGFAMMNRLNQGDPFIQLIFRSIAVAAAFVFVAACTLEIVAPELRRPLFVPFGVAFFCGTLAFLVERARKHYVLAVLGFLAAVALFPGLAWILLVLFHVAYQATAADFITLIPQAVVGPSFFFLVRKRFEGRSRSVLPEK